MRSSIPLVYVFIFSFFHCSCGKENERSFAYGNFEAMDILVSVSVNGELKEFRANEGDVLARGDYLGYIDTTALHLKKLQLSASTQAIASGLADLDARINVNKVNLSNLWREQERLQNLVKEGAATGKQLDDIEGQIELMLAQIESLKTNKAGIRAQIEANNMQLRQIEDQIDKSILYAPQTGTLLEKYLYQSELALPGKAIYKMANMDKMILRVYISGDQLSSVKTGDSLRVLYDGPDGDILETKGRVSWISSQAEFTPKIIQTREERVNLVYAVKVMVPNSGDLKIGMPGEVRLMHK